MTDTERLYVVAKNKAIREWGLPTWRKLGSRFRRALIAEQVLIVAGAQDDDCVPVETVVRIVRHGLIHTAKES